MQAAYHQEISIESSYLCDYSGALSLFERVQTPGICRSLLEKRHRRRAPRTGAGRAGVKGVFVDRNQVSMQPPDSAAAFPDADGAARVENTSNRRCLRQQAASAWRGGLDPGLVRGTAREAPRRRESPGLADPDLHLGRLTGSETLDLDIVFLQGIVHLAGGHAQEPRRLGLHPPAFLHGPDQAFAGGFDFGNLLPGSGPGLAGSGR